MFQKLKLKFEIEAMDKSIIYRQQIATPNPETKIVSVFDNDRKQQQVHKCITISHDQLMMFQTLFFLRQQVRTRILNSQQRTKTNLLEGGVSYEVNHHFEQHRTGQVILDINQQYMQGVTLRSFITKNNINMINSARFLPTIMHQLLDLFLRIDANSLFVPSFQNILINQQTLELNLVLFSFTGIEVFEGRDVIAKHQIKQIAAFFESDHFLKEKKGINVRRALILIILGLLLGKEIDLHPQKQFSTASVKLSAFARLIEQNSAQCSKLLSFKAVRDILASFQTNQGLYLTAPMAQLLIKEENLSWGELLYEIFKPPLQRYLIKIEKEYLSMDINLDQYLKQIALSKWSQLNILQKESMIRNRIVSVTNPDLMLNYEDIEPFLLYTLHLSMKIYGSRLENYIKALQNSEKTSFTLQNLDLMFKFQKEILSLFESSSYQQIAQFRQNGMEVNQQKMKFQAKMAEYIKQSQPSDIVVGQNQLTSSDYIGYRQNQSNMCSCVSKKTENGLQGAGDKYDKKQGNYQVFNLPSEDKFLGYLDLWNETLVHKFKSQNNQWVGKTISHNLFSLREYQKMLTLSEDLSV